jgi:hypothetical protein
LGRFQIIIQSEEIRLSKLGIEHELITLRDTFDDFWGLENRYTPKNNLQRQLLSEIEHYKVHNTLQTTYPKGYCSPITRILFKALTTDSIYEQYPQLSSIREYFKSGDARVVWGACSKQYFQTAMQIGEWYVDVANDTVDVTKPKVEIHRMDSPDCPFEFIRDLKTYISIKESYHQVTAYRNSVFPELMNQFPIIAVSYVTGKLEIDRSLYPYGLRKTDPDYENTLSKLPELPPEIIHWVQQQPELEQFTHPLTENHGSPDSKSHNLQLRLVVTAINSLMRKRVAWSREPYVKSGEIKFLTPIFFEEKTQRQK